MTSKLTGLGLAGLAALAIAGCAATPRPGPLVISQQCADLDFPVVGASCMCEGQRFADRVPAPANPRS